MVEMIENLFIWLCGLCGLNLLIWLRGLNWGELGAKWYDFG